MGRVYPHIIFYVSRFESRVCYGVIFSTWVGFETLYKEVSTTSQVVSHVRFMEKASFEFYKGYGKRSFH